MKLIDKLIYENLPLEVNKIYKTQAGDEFKIIELIPFHVKGDKFGIVHSRVGMRVRGNYIKYPNLGICDIYEELIVKEKKYLKTVKICSHCKEEIE